MKKRLFVFFQFIFVAIFAQHHPLQTKDSLVQQQWIDSIYKELTINERIGQLIMVMASSDQEDKITREIRYQIAQGRVGGVIFSKGGPLRQAKMTNDFQLVAKTPLLIAMDAEWGLAMRLDSTYAFPWNMTLGAIKDSSIVEKIGKRIGKHCKRLGVHMNFAPVVDVNTNPDNPIIGNRSFGESKFNVLRNATAFLKGLNGEGILSSAKHFPGHGDTSTDSHKVLPFLDFTLKRLDSIELYPYKNLFDKGVSSVMVAHLNIPSLEPEEGLPSSLSKTITTKLLKKDLGFKGLIFTDALNMKAVSEFAEPDEVGLKAFLAGNDILLMPEDVDKTILKIREAFDHNQFSERRLAHSVKKVLMAKYKAGLFRRELIQESNLFSDLNSVEDDLLYERAIENAITALKKEEGVLPIENLQHKKIACVTLGDNENQSFIKTLKKYGEVTPISAKSISEYKKKLRDFNLIIIGLHKSNKNPWKDHSLTAAEKLWIQEMAGLESSKSILVSFTNPYALHDIADFSRLDGVVLAYQNSGLAQKKAAEILFGAIGSKGRLPVSIWNHFPVNFGLETKPIDRLGFSIPERVGIDSKKLGRVDKLMQEALKSKMFPGAQVLIARQGKVVYNKCFGKPTYDSATPINEDHLFDLASLTKILSTLPLLMKMEEQGKLNLNDTFKDLIPEYAETELKDVSVIKSLSHYGRLPAWISFYSSTLNQKKRPSGEYYRQNPQQGFSIKVTDRLYLADSYKDTIYNRIGRQSLKPKQYRYSDVGYYVFKKYIEDQYNERLDLLLEKRFLKPLGANNLSYNPLNKFNRDRIIPSEEDNYFRHQKIQGYVHDMGAAMQGGVGGHAGLFGNALDVAKVMQMYLQDGYYGGQRFLKGRTVKKFNTCYFCDESVRRGVGFDKPQLGGSGPTCGCVSKKSFGHSGFTGTYTWADPEEDLVYVFLSNRTYPTQKNRLLIKSGLRTRIQKAIYDSFIY